MEWSCRSTPFLHKTRTTFISEVMWFHGATDGRHSESVQSHSQTTVKVGFLLWMELLHDKKLTLQIRFTCDNWNTRWKCFSFSTLLQVMHFLFRRFNLTRSSPYSDMSNSALDEVITDMVAGNDLLGAEAVRAQLLSQSIRVQRRRVREAMVRVNPRAAALRAMSHTLHRRTYRVAGPNSLWHLDGNHKLIRYVYHIYVC